MYDKHAAFPDLSVYEPHQHFCFELSYKSFDNFFPFHFNFSIYSCIGLLLRLLPLRLLLHSSPFDVGGEQKKAGIHLLGYRLASSLEQLFNMIATETCIKLENSAGISTYQYPVRFILALPIEAINAMAPPGGCNDDV